MQDPVQNRRIMGIGRVNLVAKTIDFHPIGPAERRQLRDGARSQARLRPDASTSAATSSGRSTSRDAARSAARQFEGRPRMALRVASNGKLLYIYQAGATIDVYDAATYKLLRTIDARRRQTTHAASSCRGTQPRHCRRLRPP